MFSLLFRNRRFALAWAALILASVAIFAGEDGGAERLAESARQVRVQRHMLESPPAHQAPVRPAPPPSLPDVPIEADRPLLWAVPGSSADPANPQVGDVFFDPISGERVRAVSRRDAGSSAPVLPQP